MNKRHFVVSLTLITATWMALIVSIGSHAGETLPKQLGQPKWLPDLKKIDISTAPTRCPACKDKLRNYICGQFYLSAIDALRQSGSRGQDDQLTNSLTGETGERRCRYISEEDGEQLAEIQALCIMDTAMRQNCPQRHTQHRAINGTLIHYCHLNDDLGSCKNPIRGRVRLHVPGDQYGGQLSDPDKYVLCLHPVDKIDEFADECLEAAT